MRDIDCLCILLLHLGVLFVFSSSVVAVESGGSGASVVGKGGVSAQSVCPADTKIMHVRVAGVLGGATEELFVFVPVLLF